MRVNRFARLDEIDPENATVEQVVWLKRELWTEYIRMAQLAKAALNQIEDGFAKCETEEERQRRLDDMLTRVRKWCGEDTVTGVTSMIRDVYHAAQRR